MGLSSLLCCGLLPNRSKKEPKTPLEPSSSSKEETTSPTHASEKHTTAADMGSTSGTDLDCLIIGAGFGGCYQLKLLRDAGLRTKVVDAASKLGGVWAWNRYPGARVDVEMPFYGYSDPKVWSTWEWTQRFPSCYELLDYFDHVDKVWDLSKDVELGVTVTSATYTQDDAGKPIWVVETAGGTTYRARFLVCGTGTSFKQYIPKFEGLDTFKGAIHHSALWPEDLDIKGKRVAVIGAGSTGIQVMQEAAKVCPKVTQFIRSPNLALPMRQRDVSRAERYAYKPIYDAAFKACRQTSSGLPIWNTGLKVFDVNDEERSRIWEEGWERGGFNWSLGGFIDTSVDKKANRALYDFWASKVRQRIPNPKKRELLAPLEPPYFIGTKRPSLESDYYEMISKDNVEVTNSPIVRLTEKGIVTEDGKEEEFDVIAICTGYDAVTGGLMTMNIKGQDGVFLHDKWSTGVSTYLGVMSHGFPNMFMLYGPQAPTSLSNGPPFLELEVEWVRDVIKGVLDEGKTTIDAKKEKEEAWRELVLGIAEKTLLIYTNSWYMGANVPGKRREFLLYMGGVKNWHDQCVAAAKDWEGFTVA